MKLNVITAAILKALLPALHKFIDSLSDAQLDKLAVFLSAKLPLEKIVGPTLERQRIREALTIALQTVRALCDAKL